MNRKLFVVNCVEKFLFFVYLDLFYVLYGPEQSDYRNIKKVEKG